MVCGLNDGIVAQPNDALLVGTDFGAVLMVRLELMRLDVTVNERMRVIGVGLMQVLTRHRRGTDKPRHKGESNDGAPKPSRHNFIMSQSLHGVFPVAHRSQARDGVPSSRARLRGVRRGSARGIESIRQAASAWAILPCNPPQDQPAWMAIWFWRRTA